MKDVTRTQWCASLDFSEPPPKEDMAQYRTLKVGDRRQLGDQVRKLWNLQRGLKPNDSTQQPNPGDWHEVNLIDWPILPADLFNAEFRRRII